MGRLTPKYEPALTFNVEKDGFYGYYYEPAENKFPGKSMVICTGSDGSFNGGLHCCAGSPFSMNGKVVPCVMAGNTKEETDAIVKRMKKSMVKHLEPDMLFFYSELLNGPHSEEADIRVENINGPVLLISGKEDVMVPADWTCEEVVKRLKEHNFSHPFRHNSYSPLSHYACPLRPMTSSMFRVERRRAKECNASRDRAWADTLSFLQNEWKIS